MADASAAARAAGHLGGARAQAGGSAEVQVTGFLVAGILVAAAAVLWWTAGSYARPRFELGPFTEAESAAHDFASHVAHPAELLTAPAMIPHRYPKRTAPGVTVTMHQGFSPQWRPQDPAIAAMPAEAPW